MRTRTLGVWLALGVAVGCDDGGTELAPVVDAVVVDSMIEDAEAFDAAAADAARMDAAVADAAIAVDAAAVDAVVVFDAAIAVDAAPPSRFASDLPDWCQGQPDTFSFFVTSFNALWDLSGTPREDLSGGFGGDLGGLAGADEICQTIAAATGHGHRTWRAFLSATDDGAGDPVHAIERIGLGPWYDANGRLVAEDLAGLMGERPAGDPQSVDDLPDECGVPLTALGDAHDTVTGSNSQGRLNTMNPEGTCMDWTSSDGDIGGGGEGPQGIRDAPLRCGHSFPRPGARRGGRHWIDDHGLKGCGKGAVLVQSFEGDCIGCLGGYGQFYCFAAD